MLNRVAFVLLGLHSWALVFKIPAVLRELFAGFRPGGHGIADAEFWAFSPMDAGFRPWYNKIARDYQFQGRFGYAWDDGLGMPLGVRIYNNLATYKVLYGLGSRRMMAIGYLVMVGLSAVVCGWSFSPLVGVIVGVLAAGSPLLVASYTHLGKPEVFWWGAVIPFVVAAFSDQGLVAGFWWSFLAWVNLPIAVLMLFMLGPALVVESFTSGMTIGLIGGMLPGIVKIGFRALLMWRTGFLSALTAEQSRLWKRSWLPRPLELCWWLPFTVAIAAAAPHTPQQLVVGGLIVLGGVGLYWANFRIIYLSDIQSIHLAFWGIGLGYVAAMQSMVGLVAIILLAYNRPPYFGIPRTVEEAGPNGSVDLWQHRLQTAWQQIKAYPGITPLRFPMPAPLKAFFETIPDQARILAEADGDPRTDSPFRGFWLWTEEFLPRRQIDLVSEIYTRLVEPQLADQYVSRFNSREMTPQEMHQICMVLGISYVVTSTPATTEALQTVGYQQIAQVELKALEAFRKVILHLPSETLTLLRAPSPVTVIDPTTAWERQGNSLTWEARAGQPYVIRYRYNPHFKAYQKDELLNVETFRPIRELPLRFMRVQARTDDPITLAFRPNWI